MSKVIYVTYDGLMEPLGQSQVLQYLKQLANQHTITLVSYEKPADWQDTPRRENLKREVSHAGIRWVPLKYHKRPSVVATAYDILIGLLVCIFFVVTGNIKIVHARSYVPSVIALALKKFFGLRYVFDMRGFWPDERLDGNVWPPGSRIYRVAKWFERRFFQNADIVVSLTHAGIREIKKFSYLQKSMPSFEVISTCTNLNLFRTPEGGNNKKDRPFTLGYVGTVGTWYLLDEMLACFKVLLSRRPDARMIFVNRNEHDLIRERLNVLAIPDDCVEIKSVNHAEVVHEMSQMDAGILFIKPVFSKKASAPTKLGEFLACGIPCLGNAGVGDVEMVLNEKGVGVVVEAFNERAFQVAVSQLLDLIETPGTSVRCRSAAESFFSLDEGVRKYEVIYQTLS